MDRETLKQKIADAIGGAFEGKAGWNEVCADAVLSAISEAGCVIVPKEPTRPMLEAARDWSTEVYGKPVGNGAASGILKAMLSASPFRQEE